MGRWGPYLFEGDTDLDEAIQISKDAGIELYMYEVDPEDPEHCRGKGLEATCAHLNSGVLKELFVKTLPTKRLMLSGTIWLARSSELSCLVCHMAQKSLLEVEDSRTDCVQRPSPCA